MNPFPQSSAVPARPLSLPFIQRSGLDSLALTIDVTASEAGAGFAFTHGFGDPPLLSAAVPESSTWAMMLLDFRASAWRAIAAGHAAHAARMGGENFFRKSEDRNIVILPADRSAEIQNSLSLLAAGHRNSIL